MREPCKQQDHATVKNRVESVQINGSATQTKLKKLDTCR